MYIAALRIADDFGLDAVGIQYQQGLKDVVPACDLAEGLLNDGRPPAGASRDGERELYAGRPLPHFNEVDEGVAVDALITNRVWTAMGLDPATTLHDVRWGEDYDGEFVWVFEISGSVPAVALRRLRQEHSDAPAADVLPAGRRTINGVADPGRDRLDARLPDGRRAPGRHRARPRRRAAGRGDAASPGRHRPAWPIMHAVLHGVTRDQFMARHKANHIQVVYAPDGETADRALRAKAAMFAELGLAVHVCGDVEI